LQAVPIRWTSSRLAALQRPAANTVVRKNEPACRGGGRHSPRARPLLPG
jgi:hypothetical protein